MRLKIIVLSLWVIVLYYGLIGCQPVKQLSISPFGYYQLPATFPQVEHPEDNALIQARVELGRRLFYDPILSGDSTVSCASCHKQAFAFSDTLPISFGVEQRLGTQNAPSLTNIAYATSFTRAGGVPTLEMQVLVPIQETHELDFNIVLAGRRLAKDSVYSVLSKAAYDRTPDPYVITRALAAFERTLLSSNSAYDEYYYNNKKGALSKAAKRGMALFMSERTNCSTCHVPPHFSNFAFENNGLYEVYADSGKMRLTNKEADRALFKVPSLRNIAVTAPYMHNGSIATLEHVIEHYNQGGKQHPHKHKLIQPLNLTKAEQQELIAFLEALTDHAFLKNEALSNPYD